jgi:hypothetical protein
MSVMPLDDLDMELLSIEGAGLSAIDIPEHLTELTEMIPEVYWDCMGVFDGQKAATTLPELRGPDVDFAIELDPTKPLPKPCRPYHMNSVVTNTSSGNCRKTSQEHWWGSYQSWCDSYWNWSSLAPGTGEEVLELVITTSKSW